MIRVYYLETETSDGIEKVKGQKFIHHATLTTEGALSKLLQDTSDEEHAELARLANSWREATEAEVACYLQDRSAAINHQPALSIEELAKQLDGLKDRVARLETKLGR